MHHIRKVLLAAAMAFLCLGSAFPAFADEPVGTDVTVIEETEDDTPENTENTQAADTKKDHVSHKAKVSQSSEDEYVDAGPGAGKKEDPPKQEEISMGRFSITGYCNCENGSGGHGLTYSGTTPTPNHTVSADLDVFPLGTKLKIDGIIYTVEDKGSSVNGNILDIFYGSHAEALAKGTYTAEVFLIEE